MIQNIYRLIYLSFLPIFIFCWLGCGDKSNPPGPGNPDAPFFLDNYLPPDGSENQPLQLTLSWSFSDPNGDSLTYDLYFGEESPPPLVDSAITDTTYDTPVLTPGKICYWFVVARDPDENRASSPILSFTPKSSISFVYPLFVGNRWEYSGALTYFNFSNDSIQSSISIDTIRSTSNVHIAAIDTFFDTLEIYRFHEEYRILNKKYHSDKYFSNLNDGFYYYGDSHSTGTHATPLKTQPGFHFRFRDRNYNSVHDIFETVRIDAEVRAKISDQTVNEQPPFKSLHYPLEVGIQWNFRKSGNPKRIDKKILDFHNVNVPAGDFSCFDVQWLWDGNEDGEWDKNIERHDYISQYGLVSRHTTIRGIVHIDYMSWDSLGTFDAREDFILTDYQIR